MTLMLLWSDLLKECLRHASGERLICLKQLECATLGKSNALIDGPLHACIQRIVQADNKMSSRERVKSTSELMALAQFGAGSLGTAIGGIYGSTEASRIFEILFIGKFLTHIIGQREIYSFLIPENLLRTNQLEEADISGLAAVPVTRELLGRASNALKLAQAGAADIKHTELRTLILYELKLLNKRIKVLSADPRINGPIELVFWDRLFTSLSLLFKKRSGL